jgi:GT2 family glycosyltransferase
MLNLWVIVPVYGNWADTLDCLKALESQNTREFQILIADDGSPEPPPEAIRSGALGGYRRYENAGFAATCIRAAKEAMSLGATHLLFLNNDTEFGPLFIQTWLKRVSEYPLAILTPLICWSSQPDRIWSSGGKLTVLTPFVRARRRFSEVTEVEIATGCALLVPVEVWTALGGFDPQYFIYFEDFDLAIRARNKGFRIYVIPDDEVRVLHRVSGSFRQSDSWRKNLLMLTASLVFIRSHFRGFRKILAIGLAFFHLGWTLLANIPRFPPLSPLWTALVRGFASSK